MIGYVLNYVFAPIGFNWQISVALIPDWRRVKLWSARWARCIRSRAMMRARHCRPSLRSSGRWRRRDSLLAWFVFAPQCLSTIAAIKRETGGWKMPLITMGYLFVLAYFGLVHHLSCCTCVVVSSKVVPFVHVSGHYQQGSDLQSRSSHPALAAPSEPLRQRRCIVDMAIHKAGSDVQSGDIDHFISHASEPGS